MASSSSKRKQDDVAHELEKPPQPKTRIKKKDKVLSSVVSFRSLWTVDKWKAALRQEFKLAVVELERMRQDFAAQRLAQRRPPPAFSFDGLQPGEPPATSFLTQQLDAAAVRLLGDHVQKLLASFPGFKRGDFVMSIRKNYPMPLIMCIEAGDIPVKLWNSHRFPQQDCYYFRVLEQYQPEWQEFKSDGYFTFPKQQEWPKLCYVLPMSRFLYTAAMSHVKNSVLYYQPQLPVMEGSKWVISDDGTNKYRSHLQLFSPLEFLPNFFQRFPAQGMQGIPWDDLHAIKREVQAHLPLDLVNIVTSYDNRINHPMVRAAKEIAVPQAVSL